MKKSKSQDSPSVETMVGRVICALLAIPLLAWGWPAVIMEADDLLHIGPGGDVGPLFTLTANIGVGFFIGIQLSANLFRHMQGKSRRRNPWQIVLVLFSAFCLLVTLFFNYDPFIALIRDDVNRKILDLIAGGIVLAPVLAWFWVNLMRFIKENWPPLYDYRNEYPKIE